MNTSKNLYSIPRGTVIRGKWHNHTYIIERELGYGATGTVYLVKGQQGSAALKVSSQLSITSEMNVLKAFDKVQGSSLGPSLLDTDDWQDRGQLFSFYVMEYIHGPTLSTFIQSRGPSWIGVLMLQLLENLQALHNEGWVFGDIKPDNLIVTGTPFSLRCIDVGGTTKQGRAIKEYTEFFDRGYWGAGSRKAEPSYDLFAAAMVAVSLVYPKRFARKERDPEQLVKMIRQSKELEPYAGVLIKAIKGKYHSALDMRKEMLTALSPVSPKRVPVRSDKEAVKGRAASKQRKRKQKHLETAVIILSVLVCYMVYVFIELL
ncbi:serine/threonine-protein kinase [Bacillus ectoiniformans]|nr:serine/threonine-protein kinase [Bacillus ectoiniformans]